MYACPKCKNKIHKKEPEIECQNCGAKICFKDNVIEYDYDRMLFDAYKEKYLLNKVLNNNGTLSYIFLPEGSISLDERTDVKRFRDFIESNIVNNGGRLLDVGCGPLEVPGYLKFKENHGINLFGVDPEKGSKFKGTLVHGCSEFLPFENSLFDIAVFATSFDHLCSLEQSVKEIRRVLKEAGKVILWVSDKSDSELTGIKKLIHKLKVIRKSLLEGYRVDRFRIYENGTVLYVPNGAVDPFHSYFESPNHTIALFEKEGFELIECKYKNKNEIFISMRKL